MDDKKKRSGTEDDDDVPASEESNEERDVDAESSPNSGTGSPLPRVDRPIGEERKNLRRREEWFRRRSGDDI